MPDEAVTDGADLTIAAPAPVKARPNETAEMTISFLFLIFTDKIPCFLVLKMTKEKHPCPTLEISWIDQEKEDQPHLREE